jgi:hypothetical protein
LDAVLDRDPHLLTKEGRQITVITRDALDSSSTIQAKPALLKTTRKWFRSWRMKLNNLKEPLRVEKKM